MKSPYKNYFKMIWWHYFPQSFASFTCQRLSVWAGLHRIQAQAASLDFEIWSSTQDSKHIFMIWFPFPSCGTNWRITSSFPFWSYIQSPKKESQQLLLVILWKKTSDLRNTPKVLQIVCTFLICFFSFTLIDLALGPL